MMRIKKIVLNLLVVCITTLVFAKSVFAESQFLLQSLNDQNQFIWADQEKPTIFIFMTRRCAKCINDYIQFTARVQKERLTNIKILAIMNAATWRMGSEALDESKISPTMRKMFYFDPGNRLAKFAKVDPRSEATNILILKGPTILAISSFDLKASGALNRYLGMLK